ncbi:MAG: DNA-directed RNA polymerase sigma-70 factor [Chitinophagales bacterium]|nr:MAG: DNA-directed RNA polymerase sigma-70 factor [Chitinophagales bacterium]
MFRISEKQLKIRLQDSSTRADAFNAVVRQYKERIYWYVRRIVADHHDAKDVTQNVFMKAWEGLDRFQFQCGIFTWLYRIATNESLNHLRRKCRQANIPLDEAGELIAQAIDRGLYISGDEIYLKLEKAVARLPEKQRIVFILRYFEERDYSEIAQITNTAEGTLHATYHIAVKKIEKYLSE